MTTDPADNAATPDLETHVVPKVYMTADVPGIGGRIKARDTDFLVEEIPLYTPVGDGEHLYLFVEKQGMSTLDMLGIVAKHFRVHRRAVGYAGLKDKHAVTRQMISVHAPGQRPEDFPEIRHEQIRVLWADIHTNKLRPGHLHGNRFSIKIRGVRMTDALVAKRVIDRLRETGVPNRIGEQRFGMLAQNHIIGRELILGRDREALDVLLGPDEAHPKNHPEARALYASGDYRAAAGRLPFAMRTERGLLDRLARGESAAGAWASADKRAVGFFMSAFQSAVFNAVLDDRVSAGVIGTLLPGDVAMKHENRALFEVTSEMGDDPHEAERCARFEISPTGPMWGPSMLHAFDRVGETEERLLRSFGVSPADVERAHEVRRLPIQGSRRPLRVPIIDPEIEGGTDEHGPYVRCAFDLPRGSFATVVMREIIKPGPDEPLDGEPEPIAEG
ncbi:MAG: tRNA pseudouridine(13) synthase TruD [Phycisphaerales bacterium]|nr:MAG: tRNA pseudouridine(13) synthase TruD [Phycisphaerales bacterium]